MHLASFSELAEKHANTAITIWKTKGESKFITSDIPILLEENVKENDLDPFLISKQFTLTLNCNYAVILSHNKFQLLSQIKREEVHNSRVWSINNAILEKSNRFVLGSKEHIKSFRKDKEQILDVILTPESIFNTIVQLYSKFPTTVENAEMKKLFKKYIDIYSNKRTFTKEEQYTLIEGMKQINKESFRKKL